MNKLQSVTLKQQNNILPEKCFICGSHYQYLLTHYDTYYKTSAKEYDVYQCEKCRLLKIFPEPTLDEIKTFYPKDYYSYGSVSPYSFFEKLKDEILNLHYKKKPASFLFRIFAYLFKNALGAIPLTYPKQGGKFLDIGCGDGYWIKKCQQYGWDGIGVEFVGQKEAQIIIGDFLNIDIKDQFEFIRISHVLEHVLHPESYLRKIASLLEEKGECHIGVPNTNSLYFKWFGRYWFPLDVPRHLHGFNDENLRLLAEKNGLKVQEIKYTNNGLSGSIVNFLNIKFNLKITDSLHLLALLFLPFDIIVKFLTSSSDNITLIVSKK
ncbi:MAG: hypothetical protein DRQ99_25605 [Candidatus Parabeggiatoa sp. nov. 3]|nr:MAG: hypothetical protein DRQ99_25605 [Gammaproteobacteria bacterium]